MEIDQRIPDLSDKELENLHANAVRLAQSGKQIQREQAERLLPLLSAALEERRAARVKARPPPKRASTSKKTKPAAAEKESVDEL